VWTLALRGGERVAVVPGEWSDAFGVVTHGRVQLELRDGEPGPVLGPDADNATRAGTPLRRRVLAPRHRRPRPAESRPSHGEGAHRLPPGPWPSPVSQHTSYDSYRMMEERHEQHE
jgi:hypothetical protein